MGLASYLKRFYDEIFLSKLFSLRQIPLSLAIVGQIENFVIKGIIIRANPSENLPFGIDIFLLRIRRGGNLKIRRFQ